MICYNRDRRYLFLIIIYSISNSLVIVTDKSFGVRFCLIQLLMQKIVVVEVEVGGRPGRLAGAVGMLDGGLPSLGCVIFHEIIAKINPRRGFAIEFGKLHLVGCPFQRFCELGDGGTREVVNGAVHSARTAAGAMGGRGGLQGSRPSEVVYVLVRVLMHRGTKVAELVSSGRRWGGREAGTVGAVGAADGRGQ